MSDLTISELNSAIMHGDWSSEQLESMIMAIKYARNQRTRRAASTFWPGDTVKFHDRKRGVTYTGKVEKVKLKFALVVTPTTRFNVPLSILEAA